MLKQKGEISWRTRWRTTGNKLQRRDGELVSTRDHFQIVLSIERQSAPKLYTAKQDQQTRQLYLYIYVHTHTCIWGEETLGKLRAEAVGLQAGAER